MSNIKDVSIIFCINQYNIPSTEMRAVQICDKLKSLNYKASIIEYEGFTGNISNSICIFVKLYSISFIEVLKKNNNILIYDYVDIYPENIDIVTTLFDSIIVYNQNMLNDLRFKYNYQGYPIIIYHHWDERYLNIKKLPLKDITIGYIGAGNNVKTNLVHYNKLVKHNHIKVIDINTAKDITNILMKRKNQKKTLDKFKMTHYKSNNFTSMVIPINCHLNIRRKSSREYKYKPNTKLSTAAALDHNIITTDDIAVRELLPRNYPYLLKSVRYNHIVNMIKYVKSTYNKPIWFKALSMMQQIKHRTSLNTIIKDYINLFVHLINTK